MWTRHPVLTEMTVLPCSMLEMAKFGTKVSIIENNLLMGTITKCRQECHQISTSVILLISLRSVFEGGQPLT